MSSVNNIQTGGRKMEEGERSFTCEKIRGQPCHAKGRYIIKKGQTPAVAAKRAFTSYCKRNNRGSRCVAHLSIRETTRGSAKKIFAYNASRKILKGKDKKTVTLSNGQKITYKYKTDIYSIPFEKYNRKN